MHQSSSKHLFHSFVGLSVDIGDRKYMEDEYNIHVSKQGLSYFGVYDGHAGNLASTFVREHLFKAFTSKTSNEINNKEKLQTAMTESHLSVDKDFFTYEQQMKSKSSSNSGTTAVSLVLNESKFSKKKYLPNIFATHQ